MVHGSHIVTEWLVCDSTAPEKCSLQTYMYQYLSLFIALTHTLNSW